MSRLVISLLGDFAVALDGRPVTAFESDQVRALLAYLAAAPGRPYPRATLADLLWPNYPDAAARANLRHALSRLRHALADHDAAEPLLLADARVVGLNPAASIRVDLADFEALVAACAAHSHPSPESCAVCAGRLREAAALYGGPLLAQTPLSRSPVFEEWLLARRAELERHMQSVLDTLARAAEAAADFEQMRRYAERQLALDPWREEAHAQLMRALAALGQRGAALAQFERCRDILRDELGAGPSAELLALSEEIRAGGPRGEGEAAPVARLRGPVRRRSWSEVPDVGPLYGRQEAALQLEQWMVDERCRVVAVVGMGGIGKTSLAASLAQALTPRFEAVVWYTLVNGPPLEETLRALIDALAEEPSAPPAGLEEQQAMLLDLLRGRRCLLVLDNLESLLDDAEAGAFRAGFEPYGRLIRRIAEGRHTSCLLLTSRERPAELLRLEGATPAVRTLRLAGLDQAAGHALLAGRGLQLSEHEAQTLVERYSGNALALSLAAQTISELFASDVGAFLAARAPIFDDIRAVLDQQWARLSERERELLLWLAVEREPATLPTLRANLVQPGPPRAILEALRSLHLRSLVEQVAPPAQAAGPVYAIQNVIREYATDRLVDAACDELAGEQLDLVNRHALIQERAPTHIREHQLRLILEPVAERLLDRLGRPALEARLRRHLARLRAVALRAPGYAAGTVLNLLLFIGVAPVGYDAAPPILWDVAPPGRPTIAAGLADNEGHPVFGDGFGVAPALVLGAGAALASPGGAARLPSGDRLHVWQIDLGDLARLHGRLWGALSDDERERAERFQVDRDRRRFAAGRGALRAILAGYLGCAPSEIRFTYDALGKPRLAADGAPALHFNLAHSAELGLCAVAAEREVGVDLERIDAGIDYMLIAQRFFTAGEYAALQALPAEQARLRFFDYWTRKEAFAKARGLGLALGMRRFDIAAETGDSATTLVAPGAGGAPQPWWLRGLSIAPGYAAAVACAGGPASVSMLTWPAR